MIHKSREQRKKGEQRIQGRVENTRESREQKARAESTREEQRTQGRAENTKQRIENIRQSTEHEGGGALLSGAAHIRAGALFSGGAQNTRLGLLSVVGLFTVVETS
jgi:hypothetical protein